MAQAKASTAHAVSALSKCVKEAAAYTEKQTSRIVGTVAQQLEKEIEVVAVRAVVTSERHTRSVADSLRNEVKAHIEQNRADFERQQEETQHTVAQVAVGLKELTRQLNSFKPASADVVGDLKENLSKEVAEKLSDSEQKVNQLVDSLEEQKKSVNDSAECGGLRR